MISLDSISDLKTIVGSENVLTDSSEFYVYSYDSQPLLAIPDAMVIVSTKDEAASVVRHAAEWHIPVAPSRESRINYNR